MSGRIRRVDSVSVNGSSVSNVSEVSWNDALEFDRSQGDDEMHGKPVQMKEGGSGQLVLLSGSIDSGYGTANMVVAYHEITVSSGVESESTKTLTFEDVTFNNGGRVPGEGRGEFSVPFEYGKLTIS